MRSLASSASRLRDIILEADGQFSKVSDDHLVELTRFDTTTNQVPSTQTFKDESQISRCLSNNRHSALPRPGSVEIQYAPLMDVFNADYAERFSSLLQQNCGLRPPNVSSTMVGLPLKRHDLGSSFLQMLPYFRDRRLPTGQAFTGSLRSTQSADQTRKLSVTLPDLRSKLSTYQSSDGFTGMPKSYKSSLEILDAFGAQAYITFTTARPQNRRSSSSVRLPKPFSTDYLCTILRQTAVRSAVLAAPMLIHAMLISAHLRYWTERLGYEETFLLKEVRGLPLTSKSYMRTNQA